MRIPGFSVRRGVHAAGTELPRHCHDDPTLCYVLRGRFTEFSRGRATDCVSDQLKLTPAGETHWNRFAATETRGLRIDVDRDRFAESPAILRLLDERLQVAGPRGRSLMRRVLLELDAADEVSSLVVEGLLVELIATLARESLPHVTPRIPAWLQNAEAIVQAEYTQPIFLGNVARAVGVAPATLARGYRAAFNLTLGERVRQLRIDRASRELVETAEPIAVIAVRAGFYDQSHFSNLFRSQLGVTPAQYRAAGRGR